MKSKWSGGNKRMKKRKKEAKITEGKEEGQGGNIRRRE
jgi:hypothetical protein